VRGVLSVAADALVRANGLADAPGGRLTDHYTSPLLHNLPIGDMQETRTVAYVLQMSATLQAHDGQADAALESARSILGVARVPNATPTLINALVGMAIRSVAVTTLERVLGQGEPSPAALAAAQTAFTAEAERPLFRDAYRGERAMVEDFKRAVETGLVTRAQ